MLQIKPLSVAISIHAAQEGCDEISKEFYRRAKNISIHAAQEGCDKIGSLKALRMVISIHAAQEGCDAITLAKEIDYWQFQSTQPRGRATLTRR